MRGNGCMKLYNEPAYEQQQWPVMFETSNDLQRPLPSMFNF